MNLKWTVPQLMECWDSEDIDITRTLDRIIVGVFHHPALREYGEDGAADVRQIMFHTVEEWWHGKTEEEQEYLREQFTRQGVFESGHGNSLESNRTDPSSLEEAAAEAAGDGTLRGLVSGLSWWTDTTLAEGLIIEGSNINMNTRNHTTRKHHLKNSGPPGTGVPRTSKRNECDHYVPPLGSNGQTFGYNSEETYRSRLDEYSDGNGENRYGYDDRPVRDELVMILLIHIMLDSRPQYADAERQGYENDKP
ncbi:heterokaryon incompatibility protein Het-C-domain-containing protein [Aspergillus transmontanensis]|uniref:Heterokaryon incompatibility protein Het-C-domain-containing protein n=1 Tax=Aspergillus transmontanensis TaxID=1034304 RepID=A0A5N6W4G5_9EURO|nr:heterokaryon incompatibility protein Het-C-domain-containing protein [Aspergillus transmontanensis]